MKKQLTTHMLKPRGFTLIELILYVSVVTIIVTALVPFAWNIIGSGTKSAVQQEVYSQARFVSERIKFEIRNANDINSVTDTSIDLNTDLDAKTVIDWSAGKIRISYGVSGNPPAVPLHSADTRVTTIKFTDNSSVDRKSKNISFSLTMDDNFTGVRQEYKVAPIRITGSAEVRSN